MFKNQKSNGFYMENTINASLKYFESMYTCVCLATLLLTILGADYSKNSSCYKKSTITTKNFYKDKSKRSISLFNTGLILFKRAYNSTIYIRLPLNFILYDS